MTESRTIQVSFGKKKRPPLKLTVGESYSVDPLNPQKLKHRGRICTIVEFDEDVKTNLVQVRFADNNRKARLDPGDLVPVGVLLPVTEFS